jgi:hypothetical protein
MQKAVLAFILGCVFSIGGALAQLPSDNKGDTITFKIQSNYRYIVQLEFYSQSRKVAWPGGSKAYNIKDADVHDFTLNCRPGEKICYGAWVSGNQRLYWGAGMHGRQACTKCCYVCDGQETPVITLNN